MFDYYRFRFKSTRGPGSSGPVELSDLRGVIVGLGIPLVMVLMVLTGTRLKGYVSAPVALAVAMVAVLGFATVLFDYLPRTVLAFVMTVSSVIALFALYMALFISDFSPASHRVIATLIAVYGFLVAFAAHWVRRAIKRSSAREASREKPAT